MALIICKNCGKKASDTVDECIHCGKNPKEAKEFFEEKIIEEIKEEEEIKEVNFDSYSADDKEYLEQEFINEDEKARKYKVCSLELPAFRFSLFFYLGLSFITLRIFYYIIDLIELPYEVVNNTASIIAIVSGCALLTLTLGMFVYSIVKGIHLKISHSRFVYLKRFQHWLKQKNISYTPKFIKLKDKEIFDSIELD